MRSDADQSERPKGAAGAREAGAETPPDSHIGPQSPAPLPTFTRGLGSVCARLRDWVARTLLRLGVSPNLLTVIGLILSAAAGVAFAAGTWHFRLGALFVIAAGACDILDGAAAKLGGHTTAFGSVLDSSLDRYSDGFLFGGLLLHWAHRGDQLLAALSLSALIGSFAVSYLRARAENLIDSCKVGFWERGERTVLLLLAALLGVVPGALLLLGTLTHVTALQRLLHTRDRLEGRKDEAPPAAAEGPEGRRPWWGLRPLRLWWWLLHRVVFWSYPRATLPYDIAVVSVVVFTLCVPFPG